MNELPYYITAPSEPKDTDPLSISVRVTAAVVCIGVLATYTLGPESRDSTYLYPAGFLTMASGVIASVHSMIETHKKLDSLPAEEIKRRRSATTQYAVLGALLATSLGGAVAYTGTFLYQVKDRSSSDTSQPIKPLKGSHFEP